MRQDVRTGALLIILAAGLGFPKMGQAQDLKIAVVDIETLTLASDEGKAVNDKVKKKYDDIVTVMSKLQKDIEDKETKLKTQDRVMSAAAKSALAKEIETDKVNFDRKNQDYQKEISDYQNELLDPVSGKAQAILQAYIKEKNFSIVLDLSAEKGNIVWANPGNDITEDLKKRLNDEFKRTGGASAPATTTPRPAASAPAATTPRPPANTPAAPK